MEKYAYLCSVKRKQQQLKHTIMKTITKHIETITPKGTKKNFEITVFRGWHDVIKHNSEGGIDYITSEVEESDEISVTVSGQVVKGSAWSFITNVPARYAQMGIEAIFAKKVGLFKNEYEAVMQALKEARKEAEEDESWKAYKEACEQDEKWDEEHRAYVEMIEIF